MRWEKCHSQREKNYLCWEQGCIPASEAAFHSPSAAEGVFLKEEINETVSAIFGGSLVSGARSPCRLPVPLDSKQWRPGRTSAWGCELLFRKALVPTMGCSITALRDLEARLAEMKGPYLRSLSGPWGTVWLKERGQPLPRNSISYHLNWFLPLFFFFP